MLKVKALVLFGAAIDCYVPDKSSWRDESCFYFSRLRLDYCKYDVSWPPPDKYLHRPLRFEYCVVPCVSSVSIKGRLNDDSMHSIYHLREYAFLADVMVSLVDER